MVVVDISQPRIDAWNSSKLPIYEPRLDEVVFAARCVPGDARDWGDPPTRCFAAAAAAHAACDVAAARRSALRAGEGRTRGGVLRLRRLTEVPGTDTRRRPFSPRQRPQPVLLHRHQEAHRRGGRGVRQARVWPVSWARDWRPDSWRQLHMSPRFSPRPSTPDSRVPLSTVPA